MSQISFYRLTLLVGILLGSNISNAQYIPTRLSTDTVVVHAKSVANPTNVIGVIDRVIDVCPGDTLTVNLLPSLFASQIGTMDASWTRIDPPAPGTVVDGKGGNGISKAVGLTYTLLPLGPGQITYLKGHVVPNDGGDAGFNYYFWLQVRSDQTVQPPTVNVTPTPPIPLNGTASLQALVADPGAECVWYTKNNGFIQLFESNPSNIPFVTGGLSRDTTFFASAKLLPGFGLDLGCQSNLVAVPISVRGDFFIPNVFTPNNDGNNDKFFVYGGNIAYMYLAIYNQWGELVFETEDQGRGWDGNKNGKPQPVGVYTYILRGNFRDGSTLSKRGSITLIR